MSGDNQHFIPRMYLKGFKDRSVGGGKHAWVFRQDGEPTLTHIDEIAADHHFYSPPDPDSLDETITNYENRLTRQLYQLRKAPLGIFADSAVPAEVVTHLSVRTESMRTGFGFAAKQMALKMFQTFQDAENIRRMLSLDGDVPDERFKRIVTDGLKDYTDKLQVAGISPAAAERLAFVIAKEKFPQLLATAQPAIASVSAEIYHKADELVAAAQRKALAQSVVPEQRASFLATFHWEIVATDEAAILPDCVAIAFDPDGQPKPILLSDKDIATAVIMPLDHKRLLVGRKAPDIEIRPTLFNLHALSCAETFFVSSERQSKLEDWEKYIGVTSKSTMLHVLQDVFAEYTAPALPAKRGPDGPINISMTFRNAASQEVAEEVGGKVKGILAWAAQHISLDRIDTITFTNEVAEEAAVVERGFDSASQQSTQPLLAKAVSVLKDESVRVHIFLSNDTAATLLADPESPEWSAAAYHVLYMLSEANCNVEFDKSFPGIMLRAHTSMFNAIRYEPVSTAWTDYISSRFSARFWPEGIEVRRGLVKASIEALKAAMPTFAANFRENSDHSQLIRDLTPYLTAILAHSASLAGIADGQDADILTDEDVMQTFRAVNLAEWYPSYVEDLRSIWNMRGQWRSEKEFISLSRHTERILWQCGIILTEGPNGECRVEFPNLAALQQLQQGANDGTQSAPQTVDVSMLTEKAGQ